MIHVQCTGAPARPGCGSWTVIDCSCDPDVLEAARAHDGECPLANIDAQLTCLPGKGCCTEDHDHAQPCPGEHGPCLTPAQCPTWHGGMDQEGDCPGGHCGLGVPGCTGCRALTITMMAAGPGERPAAELELAGD